MSLRKGMTMITTETKFKCFNCENKIGEKSYILCDECFDEVSETKGSQIDSQIFDLARLMPHELNAQAIDQRECMLNKAIKSNFLWRLFNQGVDNEPVLMYYNDKIEYDLIEAFRQVFTYLFYELESPMFWLENTGKHFDYEFAEKINEVL